MKHFFEIIDEISTITDEITAAEAEEKNLSNQWPDLRAPHEVRVKLQQRISEAADRSNNLRIARRLLQNNARVALYHDVLPVVLEVLQKYSGKPYGDKTRVKIAQEVKARTGASAYIRSRYNNDEIDIYPDIFGNTYNIACGPKVCVDRDKQERLLIGNKINPLPLESFSLWYVKNEYITDVYGTVADIKRLYALAVEKQEELAKICSEFNHYAVSGIESIYQDKRIYNRLIVR